jgi:hypothetical protein
MQRLPGKISVCEFKLKTVWMVESGQSVAEAAGALCVVEPTHSNWRGSIESFLLRCADSWRTEVKRKVVSHVFLLIFLKRRVTLYFHRLRA